MERLALWGPGAAFPDFQARQLLQGSSLKPLPQQGWMFSLARQLAVSPIPDWLNRTSPGIVSRPFHLSAVLP